ncbi:hypothetical protein [Bradyrhizobium embrapense]|uniref:hypothetical protein n=1 Tax=Bradyrhizobium embrapense TaxID=630921 RepID=UPI00067D13B0|nr:hypothetical protein [Bradyrhizobium embrapense]
MGYVIVVIGATGDAAAAWAPTNARYFFIFLVFLATFLVAFAAFFAFLAMSSSWFGWLDEYANAVNLRAHRQANLKLARLIPGRVNAVP